MSKIDELAKLTLRQYQPSFWVTMLVQFENGEPVIKNRFIKMAKQSKMKDGVQNKFSKSVKNTKTKDKVKKKHAQKVVEENIIKDGGDLF